MNINKNYLITLGVSVLVMITICVIVLMLMLPKQSSVSKGTIVKYITKFKNNKTSLNSGLKEVIFEDGIKLSEIPKEAFAYTNLTSVVIPDGITNINYELFANCTSLATIVIPVSVTKIGSEAFINCKSIRELPYC